MIWEAPLLFTGRDLRGQSILRLLQPCCWDVSVLHSTLCTGNTVPFCCGCSLLLVERSQGFRLVRNSLLMATWGILSLNDWCSGSLELRGSSPKHSSSAWMLRGWQGVSGWLPSLLPTAVRVVMHSYPEALMLSSGTSHVPRVMAATAGSTHLPHLPPFWGISAWTHPCSLLQHTCGTPKIFAGRKQMAASTGIIESWMWFFGSAAAAQPPCSPPYLTLILALSLSYLQFSVPIKWNFLFWHVFPCSPLAQILAALFWAYVTPGCSRDWIRSPGSGDPPCLRVGPALWLAADARGKGHLSSPPPWTRLCSLLYMASG